MKTLLFVLMPLILFSGCVHKVPAGHVTSYRYTIPVYHKVHVVKKEHTYSTEIEKKQRKYKAKHKQRQILNPNSHSYAMHQRPDIKNRKIIRTKVHPRYQDVKRRPDKSKKDRDAKRASRTNYGLGYNLY